MKKPIALPRCEGHYHRQAHCDIPDGLYEEEHGRDGFFGPASHLLHRHKPTDWSGWDGPLRPHCLDLRKLPTAPLCPLQAAPVLGNAQLEVRYWRASAGVMDHLVRNADGDWLLFVHSGAGELFCDYGHFAFRDGDYILIPRGTAWRVDNATAVEMLLIEACDDAFELPERGLVGRHAQFDLAVLATPKIDKAFVAQYSEDETRVLIKRRGAISSVVFPFNPLDAVGWHGDNVPLRLNWRDFRSIASDRYHLPPPAHTTFLHRRPPGTVSEFASCASEGTRQSRARSRITGSFTRLAGPGRAGRQNDRPPATDRLGQSGASRSPGGVCTRSKRACSKGSLFAHCASSPGLPSRRSSGAPATTSRRLD